MKLPNCEWSPSNNVPAFEDDPHHAEARWSVGGDGCTDGNLHLCDVCVWLPRFDRRKKTPLRGAPFQFRPHRRTLVEAMEECQTFADRAALQAYLTAQHLGQIVSIEKYHGIDRRMNPPWDTHIVMIDAIWGEKYPAPGTPVGFTDRAVP